MFKPTPDTNLQQLIDQMMREFCLAYFHCCKGEASRVIIETDHVLPTDIQWDGSHYYMLDFTDDACAPLFDEVSDRIVACLSCTDGSPCRNASTYTQAVKFIEGLAQSEQKHITRIYAESF